MSHLRAALVLIALATTACVKQGQVREPATPAPSIYELCDDARFESMCTPAPDTQPIQVDTNLATPPSADASHLG